MLRRLLSTVLLITTLGTSFLAAADPRGPDEGYNDRGFHYNRGPDDRGSHDDRGPEARPGSGWQTNDRLPARYLDDRYAVRDWHARELPSPPPEHRWIEVDGRFILVAAATGVITSILLGGH